MILAIDLLLLPVHIRNDPGQLAIFIADRIMEVDSLPSKSYGLDVEATLNASINKACTPDFSSIFKEPKVDDFMERLTHKEKYYPQGHKINDYVRWIIGEDEQKIELICQVAGVSFTDSSTYYDLKVDDEQIVQNIKSSFVELCNYLPEEKPVLKGADNYDIFVGDPVSFITGGVRVTGELYFFRGVFSIILDKPVNHSEILSIPNGTEDAYVLSTRLVANVPRPEEKPEPVAVKSN